MTTLAEEGFLADEASGPLVGHIAAKYAPWMTELRLLNRSLVEVQYELAVHPESARELASAALFVRGLSHVQGGVLLLERGMLAPAKALLRCALESLFILGACSRDPKLALSFFDADEVNRKKWVDRLAQVKEQLVGGHVARSGKQQHANLNALGRGLHPMGTELRFDVGSQGHAGILAQVAKLHGVPGLCAGRIRWQPLR